MSWHHPECEGECIACLIEREVQKSYGSQGLDYLRRHVTSPPHRKPLTDEQQRKVARLFSDRVAEMCNVDADDHWKYHGDDVFADVQFVLKAAHGIKGEA